MRLSKWRTLGRGLLALLVISCVGAFLGIVALAVQSYRAPMYWDLTSDPHTWRTVHIADKGVTFCLNRLGSLKETLPDGPGVGPWSLFVGTHPIDTVESGLVHTSDYLEDEKQELERMLDQRDIMISFIPPSDSDRPTKALDSLMRYKGLIDRTVSRIKRFQLRLNALRMQATALRAAGLKRQGFLGIAIKKQKGPVNGTSARISLFYFAALAGAYPTIWVLRRKRRRSARRKRANQCIGCGYDLTGNVTGVCPECGLATSKSASPVEAKLYLLASASSKVLRL